VRAEGDADGLAAARTGRAAGCAELEDGGTGGGGERGEDDIPALDGGGMPEQPGGEGDGAFRGWFFQVVGETTRVGRATGPVLSSVATGQSTTRIKKPTPKRGGRLV